MAKPRTRRGHTLATKEAKAVQHGLNAVRPSTIVGGLQLMPMRVRLAADQH